MITNERMNEIAKIIGHAIPAPYSNTLLEDCRMSRPEFAMELIEAAKQYHAATVKAWIRDCHPSCV